MPHCLYFAPKTVTLNRLVLILYGTWFPDTFINNTILSHKPHESKTIEQLDQSSELPIIQLNQSANHLNYYSFIKSICRLDNQSLKRLIIRCSDVLAFIHLYFHTFRCSYISTFIHQYVLTAPLQSRLQ